jgi:hypothetical protein
MLELLSLDYDAKLQTYCVNARCDYDWFLKVTQQIENIPDIRDIYKKHQASKFYDILMTDLEQGCLLPPIVLAVNNVAMPEKLNTWRESFMDKPLEAELLHTLTEPLKNMAPENVYIIDGFHRNYAIKLIADVLTGKEATQKHFLLGRLRLEIWLNIPFGALAYRMLLSNLAQHPLSMWEQIGILSIKLHEELSTIPDIRIFTHQNPQGRTQKGEFYLYHLSRAFQAWLQGHPHLEIQNIAVAQSIAESAINTLGSSMTDFKEFVRWLVEVDYALPEAQLGFLSDRYVLQGIAAAVGAANRNANLHERMVCGLKKLLQQVQANQDNDPLGLQAFERFKNGMNPNKVNEDLARREMAFRAFQEYFICDGTKSMQACWQFAAEVGGN